MSGHGRARHPRRREQCEQRYSGRNPEGMAGRVWRERYDPEPKSRVPGDWKVIGRNLKGPHASLLQGSPE